MAASDEDYLPPVTDAAGNPLPLDDLDVGMMDEAPPEVRRAAANIPETGVLFNFEPFEQIAQLHAAGRTDEARKIYDSLDEQSRYVYKNARNMERFTAQEGARLADEFRRNQDRAAAQAADPVRQQAAAKEQMEVVEKQRVMQQSYLEELQYQNNLNLVADPNTDRTTRRAALNAIDGLAATIGKRSMGGAASRDAMRDAKKSVGSISVAQEYNPFADYGPQIELMRRGSEERMGVLRQQMEAAGVTMPEAQQVEAAKSAPGPDAAEVALQRFGVKLPDGNPLIIDGSPVIEVTKGGQPMMLKRAANGKFVELTDADRAKLQQ